MPAPKWLVIARNEYRVSTSRIRKLRPILPILLVASIAAYVFIALFGGIALFAVSLYVSTMGFRFPDPVMGMTGVSLLHSGLNLLLGYVALLVGRRRLLSME